MLLAESALDKRIADYKGTYHNSRREKMLTLQAGERGVGLPEERLG